VAQNLAPGPHFLRNCTRKNYGERASPTLSRFGFLPKPPPGSLRGLNFRANYWNAWSRGTVGKCRASCCAHCSYSFRRCGRLELRDWPGTHGIPVPLGAHLRGSNARSRTCKSGSVLLERILRGRHRTALTLQCQDSQAANRYERPTDSPYDADRPPERFHAGWPMQEEPVREVAHSGGHLMPPMLPTVYTLGSSASRVMPLPVVL
jgi:hypothetical protein